MYPLPLSSKNPDFLKILKSDAAALETSSGSREPLPTSSANKDTKKNRSASSEPYTTSIVKDGRRKFHTTYPNGEEMVEEYDLKTDRLVVRKVRRSTTLGGEGTWEYELGGDASLGLKPFNPIEDLLAPSSSNVSIARMHSPIHPRMHHVYKIIPFFLSFLPLSLIGNSQ